MYIVCSMQSVGRFLDDDNNSSNVGLSDSARGLYSAADWTAFAAVDLNNMVFMLPSSGCI